MAGRLIKGAAALSELVRPASETDAPGLHRMLPVVPELSALLPGRGLRRGSTIAVAAGRSGTVSLMLALLSAASRAGSWCAVVGVPDLGALAAEESGIALDRLALIPNPGPDWPTVAGALIDGVDVVVAAIPGPVAAAVAARLVARARQRGSVLMPFGAWPGADVTLRVTAGAWEGLGHGHGRLRRRRVTVLARGRGAADRPREATMWMPGSTAPPTFPPLDPAGPLTLPGPPLSPASAAASSPAIASPAPSPALAAPTSSALPPRFLPPGSSSLSSLPTVSVSSSSSSSSSSSAAASSSPAPSSLAPSSASIEPDRLRRSDDVVDLSVDDAADLGVSGLAVMPGSAAGAQSCVASHVSPAGRVRPVGARPSRSRGSTRDSRPAGRLRSVRVVPVRPAVPVWWEFVPAPAPASAPAPAPASAPERSATSRSVARASRSSLGVGGSRGGRAAGSSAGARALRFPAGSGASGLPAGSRASGLPAGSGASGLPVGSRASGLSAGSAARVAGIREGFGLAGAWPGRE